VTKVPFLGDLPYMGWMFKSTTRDTSRTELLVFLTPRVVTERSVIR
jgi:type IV pilus assembly protein PilQ